MGDNFASDFAHGAYLLWSDPTLGNGSLKFDIITNETVERDAEITEHPVEVGANIADHYRLKSRKVTLEAFISQEPLDPSIYPTLQGSLQGAPLTLPTYPQTLTQLIARGIFNPTGSAILIADELALGTFFGTAPNATFQSLQFSNPGDTLALTLAVLDDLYTNAVLVDVATRSAYYSQHLLGPVTTKRDKDTGTGTTISLSLTQVLFVSTQQVAAPPTPVKPKDKPSVNKGQQNPTTSNETTAHYLLGQGKSALRSYFSSGGA